MIAAVCHALGHPTRIQLVERLSASESASITELTADTGVTRQAVTKHLQMLADVGLVASEKRGRERLWRLNPEPLDAAQRWLDQLSRRWDARLARLKALVED